MVAADLSASRADKVVAPLLDQGFDALALKVDVGVEKSVASAFSEVAERFEGADVLINNAAPTRLVAEDAPIVDIVPSTLDAIVQGILRGSFLCARQAIPLIRVRAEINCQCRIDPRACW